MKVTFDWIITLCKNCSTWQDNELRYALRSIEQNVPNLGNIFIVGYKPHWIKNVIHIECEDAYKTTHLRNQNILQKLLIACNDVRVSDNFISTNDDIFLLQPLEDLPNYYEGTLEGYLEDRPILNIPYKRAIQNTLQYLTERNIPTLHFDIHTPIIYNKQLFKKVFQNIDKEVTIKSIYANIVQGNNVVLHDNKINTHKTQSRISEINKTAKFFSISDMALNIDMKKYLANTFNKKSKYE